VNDSCRAFQDHLAAALNGAPHEPCDSLRTLSWHSHLLTCSTCRDLLAAEEALDVLLATLPAPRLPAGVAERVLARLAEERQDAALDRLLELARSAPAPIGLAHGVLATLEAERQSTQLDRLLDLLPEPAAPRGLAARVLAGLDRERAPHTWIGRARRAPWLVRVAAAAALALAGAMAFDALRPKPPADEEIVDLAGVAPIGAPPPELLESLDLLQDWELINDPSVDVVLTGLDTAEEVLLEIDRGSDPLGPESDAAPEDPGKG
jgi:hypothetical protein